VRNRADPHRRQGLLALFIDFWPNLYLPALTGIQRRGRSRRSSASIFRAGCASSTGHPDGGGFAPSPTSRWSTDHRARVNNTGVSEPRGDVGTDRIIAEVPGISDTAQSGSRGKPKARAARFDYGTKQSRPTQAVEAALLTTRRPCSAATRSTAQTADGPAGPTCGRVHPQSDGASCSATTRAHVNEFFAIVLAVISAPTSSADHRRFGEITGGGLRFRP
jgi:hypothetical protein